MYEEHHTATRPGCLKDTAAELALFSIGKSRKRLMEAKLQER
jgi:hypothetical protein